MKEKIKVENVAHGGTFETALDALKNNKSVKEYLRGFKVVTADISGNSVVKRITITFVKDICVCDSKEVFDILLKAVAIALTKEMKRRQEAQND